MPTNITFVATILKNCLLLLTLCSSVTFGQTCNTLDDLYLSNPGCFISATNQYLKAGKVRVKIYQNTLSSQRATSKLVHVVGPFDLVGNSTETESAILDQLYFLRSQYGLDIVYYDFSADNSNYLQDKSIALASAMQKIDSLRGYTSSSIMIGASLGGVIARTSLRILELQNYTHGVTHYLSYDSPHLGAHVPLSLQLLPDFLANATRAAYEDNNNFVDKYILGNLLPKFEQAVDSFYATKNQVKFSAYLMQAQFETPSAKQLLIYSIYANDQRFKEATDLLNELKKLGMPQGKTLPIRNIAITNGSLTGRKLEVSNINFFDYHGSAIADSDSKLILNPSINGALCSNGSCWKFWGRLRYPDVSDELFGNGLDNYDLALKSRESNEKDSFGSDLMPCSTTFLPIYLEDKIAPTINELFSSSAPIRTTQDRSCFIPTTSALNIDSLPPTTGQTNLATLSPFDEVYGSPYNNSHESISINSCNLINYKGGTYCLSDAVKNYVTDSYQTLGGWRYINQTGTIINSFSQIKPQAKTIRVMGGIGSSSHKYLSTPPDGSRTDLWIEDGSGKQQWYVELSSDRYSYNIIVKSGITNARKYLSTTPDGTKVDLWDSDDGSGRQRWIISGNNITIKEGVTGNRRYLSTTWDGKKIDLFDKDDGSGRQKWSIEQK